MAMTKEEKERRDGFTKAALANQEWGFAFWAATDEQCRQVAAGVVKLADAVIAELDKEA